MQQLPIPRDDCVDLSDLYTQSLPLCTGGLDDNLKGCNQLMMEIKYRSKTEQ